VLFYEFFTTVIATTGPAAAHYARLEGLFTEYSSNVLLVCFAFAYPLGQAIGCLIIPPFSEAHGRRLYYTSSCGLLSLMYVISGVTSSLVGVFIGRIISGFASAVPSVVVAGSIADLYDERDRIWLVWLWNCFTILSQVLGPVYGSWVGQSLGWRWIYFLPAILAGAMVPLFCIMPETRSSVSVSASAELADGGSSAQRTDAGQNLRQHAHPGKTHSWTAIFGRPCRLLFGEPLVFTSTILCSYSMGLIYMFTESVAVVYTTPGFDFSYPESSLAFLAMAIGVAFSAVPRYVDVKRYAAAGSKATPELKLSGFLMGAPALAIGLWIFAWTIPPHVHTHWIVSMVGLLFMGFAATEISYTLQGYLTDAYTVYASSALSGLASVRAIIASVAPLIAQKMYRDLDNNSASSILAGLATLFLGTPILFLRFGPRMRRKSRYGQVFNQERILSERA
jgi:MFS family permease